MTPSNPMARFGLALPLAGSFAAVLSALALGLSALIRDLPFWMPLNATSHILHGPAAGTVTAFDFSHTAVGVAIHIGSAFFWAAIAIFAIRITGGARISAAWAAGLGTALVAGVVDYGLIPRRLSPGWELVLPAWGVIAGLAFLGIGIALGLVAARGRHSRQQVQPARPVQTLQEPEAQKPPSSPLQARRHPAPDELDQRQQRIDPAGEVTRNPNQHSDDR